VASASIVTDETILGSDAANLSASPQTPRLLPGSEIAHYQVIGHLGAGGMGTVYRARDRRLGREVAIKLRPPAAEGQTSCRLLCSLLGREAQVMAQLSHPNLVGIYDVGEHRGCIFLALELIDGTTLRQWAPGRTRTDRLAAIVAAGRGLTAAHHAGVIHRDFKPDNVLVSLAGDVKVADFGLARSKSQILAWGVACGGCGTDEANTELAGSIDDQVAGTLRYMAPAQLDGAPADEQSDQFAFAATAWEILFDTFPFPATTVGELRASIAAGPADVPDPPTRVVAALRRGLAPDPVARYPSLTALLAELAEERTT
jgi:eukaryotic-like serine/threonine-protein kinase